MRWFLASLWGRFSLQFFQVRIDALHHSGLVTRFSGLARLAEVSHAVLQITRARVGCSQRIEVGWFIPLVMRVETLQQVLNAILITLLVDQNAAQGKMCLEIVRILLGRLTELSQRLREFLLRLQRIAQIRARAGISWIEL